MNNNVKQFIEKHINLIEEEDWKTLFNKWYTTWYMFDTVADDLQLRELFDVLQSADILPNKHESARKFLITKEMNNYIDDMIFEAQDSVRFVGATNNLHSRLGFNLIELKEMFIDLCKRRNFRSADTQYNTRFWLS